VTALPAFTGDGPAFERVASRLGRSPEERDPASVRLAIEFARFVSRLAGPECPVEVLAAAALVSLRVSSSHSCADLGAFLANPSPAGVDAALRAELRADLGVEAWVERLLATPGIVERAPEAGEAPRSPLVIDGRNRLYLARYWLYEQEVARDLLARASRPVDVDEKQLELAIAEILADSPARPNLQRVAIAVAATRSLCILSGGPGTGKTTTVVHLLATLARLRRFEGGEPLSIGLAAPTGKAAARMKEAIGEARGSLDAEIKALVPEEASTIHRLLGGGSRSIYFRHDRDRKLPFDVLVVDEASMVDLPLMAKMLRALRDDARLVLVGDKDQLASVEAGSVLGDICSSPPGFSETARRRLSRLCGESDLPGADVTAVVDPLRDSIVVLEYSHRFRPTSDISRLAKAIRTGSTENVLDVFRSPGPPAESDPGRFDVEFVEMGSAPELRKRIARVVPDGYREYLGLARAGADAGLFGSFNRFRLLCAVRQGDFGVEQVNEIVAEVLEREDLIQRRGEWYPGRPVMVTRNDYSLSLFNGDVGILLSRDGRDRVRFEDGARKGQSLPPARLPAHETVFAMTIHKSQGSEFDRVVVILPPKESRILSRELLYTAITRARKGVEIWGTKDALRKAIETRLARDSGLADAIRQAAAERDA